MESHYHRHPNDTVTVHHQVLRTIVGAAALSIEGVMRLGQASGTLDRWLGLDSDGIRIVIEDDEITVDISLVIDAGVNLFETSLHVQEEVSRTMKEYVGMNVRAVNVHIEDVSFGV